MGWPCAAFRRPSGSWKGAEVRILAMSRIEDLVSYHLEEIRESAPVVVDAA
jgi:hypothetical protein